MFLDGAYRHSRMTQLMTLAALCLAAPAGYLGLHSRSRGLKPDEDADRVSLNASASPSKRPSLPTADPETARRRFAFWFVCSAAVLLAPWGLPEIPTLRFFVAVYSVMAFMRLTETWRGKAPGTSLEGFTDYIWYFTFLGEIRPHAEAQRSWGRAMGLRRMARGLLKGGGLLGLFVLSTAWHDLWDSFVPRSAWCLWAGYLAATGGADVASGLQMVLSGHGCAETFVVPPLSRSPGDFWGRRWNLVFRNMSYRVLFQRIARRYGASTAGIAVFVWSIVAHEYLVVATLGETHGDMALFFGLQGVMTLLLSRIRRGQPWPTFVAVGAHWLWMIASAPLFFAPVLEIFPAQTWPLW